MEIGEGENYGGSVVIDRQDNVANTQNIIYNLIIWVVNGFHFSDENKMLLCSYGDLYNWVFGI